VRNSGCPLVPTVTRAVFSFVFNGLQVGDKNPQKEGAMVNITIYFLPKRRIK